MTRASRTRSWRVDLPAGRAAAHRRGLAQAAAVLVLSAPLAVLAHGESGDLLPETIGGRLTGAVSLRALDAKAPLPSTRFDGVLLKGDAGDDQRGTGLDQAAVAAAWRFDADWGAYAAVEAHRGEPPKVEALWLQWRADREDQAWTLTLGRQGLATGPVLAASGPNAAYGLQPLAERATWDHPSGDLGAQVGWRRSGPDADLALDLGLWQGRTFPGARRGGQAAPGVSLHAGLAGPVWAADAVWLRVQPRARGASISPAQGHTHGTPECDSRLTEVLCFGGRADVGGASLRWDGARTALAWPLTLSTAGWLRREDGRLESANGLARYRGRTVGGWIDARWAWHPTSSVGWRHERFSANHHLDGNGALLVAQEGRLQHAQPARRDTLQLAWQPRADLRLSLEHGGESVSGVRVRFTALRLAWSGAWTTPLETP